MIQRPDHKLNQHLWLKFIAGSRDAFAALYEVNASFIFKYGHNLTEDTTLIQDAVHDLFVDLWKNRSTHSPIDNVSFYLAKSLRYKLLKTLKKRKTALKTESQQARESEHMSYQLIPDLTYQPHLNLLRSHIEQLPTKQKEIVHLKYFQGFSISEISHILAINSQSSSNLLRRAILSLRKKMVQKIRV